MGTVHAVEGGYLLRFERRLEHPPATVWQMVTDPEGLASWFPARVRYARLAVGEKLEFRFGDEQLEHAAEEGVEDVPAVSAGTILELEPERVFAFDWLGETIRIELHPEAKGCRLVFSHQLPRDDEQVPRTGAGWQVCLEALEAALAGREFRPPGDMDALKAAYAKALP